jgi:hypothetical protein
MTHGSEISTLHWSLRNFKHKINYQCTHPQDSKVLANRLFSVIVYISPPLKLASRGNPKSQKIFEGKDRSTVCKSPFFAFIQYCNG